MKTDRTTGTLRPLTVEHWTPSRHQKSPVIPYPTRVWNHRRMAVVVVSVLEPAEAPDGTGDIIPQWHLSIAGRVADPTRRTGQRPTRVAGDVLEHFVETFGFVEWEIDNHHPGAAQHFWIPRDPARRVDCECKATEVIIVEPDGYTWTNPVDGPCRGCEHERTHGRACPIHTTKTVTVPA